MKNLFAFAAFLAAGFLIGCRRSTHPGAITHQVALRVKGQDLHQLIQIQNYRNGRVVGAANSPSAAQSPAICASRVTEPGRCTGQTTRLVDEAIQTLFTTGEVKVRDHIDRRPNHRMVYELVEARLKAEHRRDCFVFDSRLLKIVLMGFKKHS